MYADFAEIPYLFVHLHSKAIYLQGYGSAKPAHAWADENHFLFHVIFLIEGEHGTYPLDWQKTLPLAGESFLLPS